MRREARDMVSEQLQPGASQDPVDHHSPLTAPKGKVDWGDWKFLRGPNMAQRDSSREMTHLTLRRVQ